MSDLMMFPDTWEEFEKTYGFNDTEEIYTNGSRLIPSFRVKQWLDHEESKQQTKQQATEASNCISRQDTIDAIKDADVCVAYNAFDIDIDEAIELAIRATKVSVIASIETLSSAQLEKKIFEKMPDTEFEKWLYEHGICHPDIHDSIPCEAVPLLIDNAINELPSAQPEQHLCRDCKWVKYYGNVDKNGNVESYWLCMNRDGGTDEEGYCHEWESR